MDWKAAEELLAKLSQVYTTDNIRKLTYNFLIFPLELRFRAGERSRSLYESIMALARDLMKDVAL